MSIYNKFRSNNKGSVALIFAIVLLLVMLSVGVAVDYSRVSRERSTAQGILDASTLAAAVEYSQEQNKKKARKVGKQFIASRYPRENNSYEISFKFDSGGVDGTFISSTKMTFMSLLSIDKVDWTVTAAANAPKLKPVEVALVFDQSGSLRVYGVHDELINALKVFGDEIEKTSVNNDLQNLYISFIPFSGTVNIGADKTKWLKSLRGSKFAPGSWGGCVMARENGHDVTDAPPRRGREFEPFLWPSERIYNNWAGETDQRNFRNIRYLNNFGFEEYGPNAGCMNPMLSLSNNLSDLNEVINRYEKAIATRVGTFPVQAMAWGHRALSPRWTGLWGGPTPDKLPSKDGIKIIIYLTDGQPRWNGITSNRRNPGHYSPYGWTDENRLGVSNPRDLGQLVGKMRSRFLDACKAARRNGIEIITIGYELSAANSEYLRQCATSPGNHYEDVQSSQIGALFRDIAERIIKEKNLIHLTN